MGAPRVLADGSVYFYYTTENLSPRITPAFLARQERLMLRAQFAQEHQNAWQDMADSFAVAVDVDAAMGTGWVERAHGTGEPG